jgi:hypothetical protein
MSGSAIVFTFSFNLIEATSASMGRREAQSPHRKHGAQVFRRMRLKTTMSGTATRG